MSVTASNGLKTASGSAITDIGDIQANLASTTALSGNTIYNVGLNSNGNLAVKVPTVSKTAVGLTPQLPNESTTTKFLRQDGSWEVPTYTTVTEGSANGTVKVNNSDVAVHGLGTAAYTASSAYATSTQGGKADTAVQSAGTGLSKSGTTLNHSNSVIAKTTQGFAQIAYDAQGHITGSTAATTAQADAINSGITSTDVAQITTNKDNIVSLYNQNGKTFNLFDINRPIDVAYHAAAVVANNAITIGSVSGDWAYVGIKALNLPAGSYRVSGKISNLVTGTAGTTRIVVSQYSSASQGSLTYINITQNGDFSGYFTWTGGDIYLLFYVNNSSSSSVNYTYTASELQIISTSAYNAGFTDYQPYALPNTAITPALKECVDNGAKNKFNPNGAPSSANMVYNGDGTYTVTKTTTGEIVFMYDTFRIDAGTYILSGCPANGSASTIIVDIRSDDGPVIGEQDLGAGATVTIPSTGTYRLSVRFGSNYTVSGLVIKPMLCDPALWAISPTFEPYALSNAELTAKEQVNENNISIIQTDLGVPRISDQTISAYANSLSHGYHTACFLTGAGIPSDAPINEICFMDIYIYSTNTALIRCYPVGSYQSVYARSKTSGAWRAWLEI